MFHPPLPSGKAKILKGSEDTELFMVNIKL